MARPPQSCSLLTHGEHSSPVYRAVVSVWAEILKVDVLAVTGDIDFFESGGDSLMAARLVRVIRERFEPSFSVAHLYKNPCFDSFWAFLSARIQSLSTPGSSKPSSKPSTASNLKPPVPRSTSSLSSISKRSNVAPSPSSKHPLNSHSSPTVTIPPDKDDVGTAFVRMRTDRRFSDAFIPSNRKYTTADKAAAHTTTSLCGRLLTECLAVLTLAVLILSGLCVGAYVAFYLSLSWDRPVYFFLPTLYASASMTWYLQLLLTKWILLGRFNPPSSGIPVWSSWLFVRWWLVDRLTDFCTTFFLSYLSGSFVLPVVLRSLGATVGDDCYIETVHFADFDLITIDDHVSIGRDAVLHPHRFESSSLVVFGRIHLGHDVWVGARSIVGPAVTMSPFSSLDHFSVLPFRTAVPASLHLRGSPPCQDLTPNPQSRSPLTPSQRAYILSFQLAVLLTLYIAASICVVPAIVLLTHILTTYGPYMAVLVLPACLLTTDTIQSLVALLLRRLVLLGKLHPGRYKLSSPYFWRRWASTRFALLDMLAYRTLPGTILAPLWLKMTGASVSSGCEVACFSELVDPDLLSLHHRCFFGSRSGAHCSVVERRTLICGPVALHDDAFLANDSLVLPYSSFGPRCVVGSISCVPSSTSHPADAVLLGSPATPLKLSLPQFPYVSAIPTPLRLLIEVVTVLTTYSLTVVSAIPTLALLFLVLTAQQNYPGPVVAAALPACFALYFLSFSLVLVVSKWILHGRINATHAYKVGSFHTIVMTFLLSLFVRLSLLTSILHGTQLLVLLFRALGCSIGKRVYLESAHLQDTDLLTIGDDVYIGTGASIQAHTAEHMLIRRDPQLIGNSCRIGINSVTLPGVVLDDGCSLYDLSLAMRGEHLGPQPSHRRGPTLWIGSPAQCIQDPLRGGSALVPTSQSKQINATTPDV